MQSQVSLRPRPGALSAVTPSVCSTTAQKGTGAYLLKSSSKRRRREADIGGQNERHELLETERQEQAQRIAYLEHEMAQLT